MEPKAIEGIYHLAPAQLGMLFETLEAAASGIHMEQIVCTLQGDLDLAAFAQAWQRVADRHSILRTCFAWQELDEPLQIALRHITVALDRQDWRGMPGAEQEARLAAYLGTERQRGFVLSAPPLMRLALITIADRAWWFVWSYHHLLLDGWSSQAVLQEVLTFYEALRQGQDIQLAQPQPYGQYIEWLRKQDQTAAAMFWRAALHGLAAPTPLGRRPPADTPPPNARGWGEQVLNLTPSFSADLISCARQARLTPNTLLQGAWALLLAAYSGQPEVTFGTTISTRPTDQPALDATVGLFINSLPLRLPLPPACPIHSWLDSVQATHLRLRDYSYCSAGQVHQWSGLPGGQPLFESLLVFQNYAGSAPTPTELHIELRPHTHYGAHTHYALTLLVGAGPSWQLRLIYDRTRLTADAAMQVLAHLERLLAALRADMLAPLVTLLASIPTDEVPWIWSPGVAARPPVAPRTPSEALIARIWADVLGLDRVSVYDNFFALGGHSLLIAQLGARLRDAFQIELPLRDLFELATIAELAERIEMIRWATQGAHAPPIPGHDDWEEIEL